MWVCKGLIKVYLKHLSFLCEKELELEPEAINSVRNSFLELQIKRETASQFSHRLS